MLALSPFNGADRSDDMTGWHHDVIKVDRRHETSRSTIKKPRYCSFSRRSWLNISAPVSMKRPQKALLDALSSSTAVWGLLLLMTASVITGSPKSRVPNYLRICHTRDPKLNDCIKDSISHLIVAMKSGSSELSVAPIDPLDIPFLEMFQSSMNASLQLTFKNTRITGLTNMEILTVK
uniref:Uncharacterized protein n=1 Tax=Timema genevievae TaxID=629358 RepID=A0A7R9JTJ3_TIMGE|nr:unnamed protein product [Timema genevievae]